jgi:hypothetical protein
MNRSALRRRIAQPGVTLREEAANPLADDRHANPMSGRGGQRQLAFEDGLNHFQSTGERESGILVNVHSAELLKDVGWVAPSSLSDSVRMNSNNVVKLHI